MGVNWKPKGIWVVEATSEYVFMSSPFNFSVKTFAAVRAFEAYMFPTTRAPVCLLPIVLIPTGPEIAPIFEFVVTFI